MYLMPLRDTVRLYSRFKLTSFTDMKYVPVRNLFSREELGIIKLKWLRQQTFKKLDTEEIEDFKKNLLENFKYKKLREKRNDLKKFILLINDSEDELKVLKSYLVDYNNSCNYQDSMFGTQIMRLFYLLNLPDKALEFFKDSDLRTVFEEMQTHQVLLSMLFENKRYQEVFQLYEEIRKHLELDETYPHQKLDYVAFGACFKLNTPDCFTYAKSLWENTQNTKQLSKSRFFLAGLAMKQNHPQYALSLVEKNAENNTVRFIKLQAYTQLGDYHNAMDIINRSIEKYKLKADGNKPCYGKQMVDDLQQAIEKSGTDEQLNEFKRFHRELMSLDLLNDETLDERLCSTFGEALKTSNEK